MFGGAVGLGVEVEEGDADGDGRVLRDGQEPAAETLALASRCTISFTSSAR